MPSSDELRLKGHLEEKERELQQLKLTIRNRDKEIQELKRKLERAKRMIGTEAVELPETIGALSERVGRIEQDNHRMQKRMEEIAEWLQGSPDPTTREIGDKLAHETASQESG